MISLAELKEQVYSANLLLVQHNLVTFTWGNASGVCRERNLAVIKPSGVEYENLTPDDMVVVCLSTGDGVDDDGVVGGSNYGGRLPLKPSSDTATHLELYRRFENIGGVVHTHSRFATIFAQARLDIPALGTTHADYFRGAIPCTRLLSSEEISGAYELETGRLIADHFVENGMNPDEIPAALVAAHGPFTWGGSAMAAAHNAVVLEEVAFMAWQNLLLNSAVQSMPAHLMDKHYLRKHGAGAYYGQGL